MRLVKHIFADRAIGLALVVVLAGCSTNAGFGTPVSNPPPVNQYEPYASPTPAPSGSFIPFDDRPGMAAPAPSGSVEPTPTPQPNTLSIAGAALRLAYDGAAKDPVSAPRVLELTFNLQNTTKNPAKVSTVTITSDKGPLGSSGVAVSAAAGQISDVAVVALRPSDNPSKYKELTLGFLDDSKKMIGASKLDVPTMDTSFTSLDEKHPKGPVTIDGVEVSPIQAGTGPHFECTFAITNASTDPVAVTGFSVKPPKGDALKVAIALPVPARATSGFVSIVLPYAGKTLPPGDYTISALRGTATVAKASAVLL